MKKSIICSVIQQSGGVGKSTVTFNLAKNLSSQGYKVLAIDNDVQSDLMPAIFGRNDKSETVIPPEVLSVDNGNIKVNSAHTLNLYTENNMFKPLEVNNNFWYMGATKHLEQAINMGFDVSAFSFVDNVESIKNEYDFILIDCLPTECLLQKSALMVSDYALLPTFLDSKSIGGIAGTIHLINQIKRRFNKKLQLLGILISRYQKRKSNPLVEREALDLLNELYSDHLFENKISDSFKMKESIDLSMSIMEYAPLSQLAKEYEATTCEFLNKIKG